MEGTDVSVKKEKERIEVNAYSQAGQRGLRPSGGPKAPNSLYGE